MGKPTTHPGLYKRGRYWWLRTDPVTGKSLSTRCTTVKAAAAFQAERERLAHDPAYAASKTALISEHIARVLNNKRAAKKSDATMRYYTEKLGHIARLFGDATALVDVNPVSADAYVTKRREEGATDHTICKERTVFNMVLGDAKRLGLWHGDTDQLWPTDLEPGYQPRTRAMTIDEIDAVEPYLDAQKSALMNISCALGLRRSEALKLEPADIDMGREMVQVRGTKTEQSNREVPILSPLKHLVERALPCLPILEAPNNLYRDMKVACKRAGIAYCTPNDWRRTFASVLAEHGVALDVTRHFTGHTDTKMLVKVYSRPRTAALRDLAEQAISQRSTGVAASADSRRSEGGRDVANSAKANGSRQESPTTERFPKPEVSSSNLLGSAQKLHTLSHWCSTSERSGVRRAFGQAGRADAAATLGHPVFRLAAAAVAMGVVR